MTDPHADWLARREEELGRADEPADAAAQAGALTALLDRRASQAVRTDTGLSGPEIARTPVDIFKERGGSAGHPEP